MKTLNNVFIYFIFVQTGLLLYSCQKDAIPDTVSPLEVENRSCSNSFSGSIGECGFNRNIKYEFNSSTDLDYIKIQGQIYDVDSYSINVVNGNNMTISEQVLGNSGKVQFKIEGGANACEIIAVKILWNSDREYGKITGNWNVKDAAGNDIVPKVSALYCNQ